MTACVDGIRCLYVSVMDSFRLLSSVILLITTSSSRLTRLSSGRTWLVVFTTLVSRSLLLLPAFASLLYVRFFFFFFLFYSASPSCYAFGSGFPQRRHFRYTFQRGQQTRKPGRQVWPWSEKDSIWSVFFSLKGDGFQAGHKIQRVIDSVAASLPVSTILVTWLMYEYSIVSIFSGNMDVPSPSIVAKRRGGWRCGRFDANA